MKKIVLSLACVVSLVSTPAMASPKPWIFSWWPGHFANLDFTKPYLQNGKDIHSRQWDRKKWNSDVWIQQKKSGEALIHGFYEAAILEDQVVWDDIPYLYVGENFYNLSGYDQERVVQSVDKVYQITNPATDDMFYLYDDVKGKVIGLYTRYGLQLQ
jgi:hypothetical protein